MTFLQSLLGHEDESSTNVEETRIQELAEAETREPLLERVWEVVEGFCS